MKYSLLSSIIFIFSSFLLFFSCGEKQYCGKSEDLGSIVFADSTKAFFLPFEKKKFVYFKDSLGNELNLSLAIDSSLYVNKRDVAQSEGCPPAKYSIQTRDKIISLKSIKIDMEISFFSDMLLTGPEYSKEHEEGVVFNLHKPDNWNGLIFFDEVIFQNTKNSVPATLKHINVTLFGKEYKDIIIDKKIIPTMCYLDKKVGIRAFRDFDNKLWVFDRFE